jgi:predicted HTH transcriptional regulator
LKKDFLDKLGIGENHEMECKLAEKALPESIWETYSSFANTEGGTIFLGIKEHRDSFTVNGLTEKQILKYQKDFWSVLNNTAKISKNILLNHHVRPIEIDGKQILRIDVPAADRHDKPVYVGTDPMKGTYRRDYEGDFLCSEEMVRAMFADQRDVSVDSEILEDMGLDALNADTIKGYRVIFEQLHEGHPWNKLLKDEFLIKLKAAAKNKNGAVSPTVAGLLMFGDADRITDVFSDYFLDYREECDDKSVRWLYRTHSNEGDWSGNLFDFFYKVTNRIDDDVAVPFGSRRNGVRVDRVDVHEALAEAVANALAHANYYGRRGIVIIKHGKKISISNPGTLRITTEEFYAGGNSDPRNPNILKMFGFVNVGERAGSGIDKIMTAWEEQNWEKPKFEVSLRAERVTLNLEVGQVVYIPGVTDLRDESYATQDTTQAAQATTQDTTQATQTATKVNGIQDRLLLLISENGKLSQKEMALRLGENYNTVKYYILQMKEKGIIERVGTSQKGHWKVLK